jgi:hypothetical protein
VVIDLDGTIIGDITPQIISYELSKTVKQTHSKYNFDMKTFRSNLATGLIRPHFETFLKSLDTHYKNIEFFIYTASEKSWAEFVIKNIEQVIGFKFNRPIFTRKECMIQDKEYKKSVYIIRKSITNSLRKKYGITYDKKDINNNLLLIDNNNVYQSSDQKHLVLCPSYNYRIPENIPACMTKDVFQKNSRGIYSVLRKYIPNYEATDDFYMFQKQYYTYYIQYLNMTQKNNIKYNSDTFWKQLKDLLITQNIKTLDDRSIRFINGHIRLQLNDRQTQQTSKQVIKSQHPHTSSRFRQYIREDKKTTFF